MEELIDTDETVDTEDGVRMSVGTGASVDIGVGEGTLGGSETVEGVGVNDDEGDEGKVTEEAVLISVMGVSKVTS